ncbi:N-acetylglucosaminidase [Virgibacillus pantothenticus]|uniref:SH3 domain-containing protein n=1 Tax=Virgibacillus pantothenticus TaxID=1473 RepID=UPI003D2A1856
MKKRKIYYLSITFLFVFLITSTSVLASPNESSNYTHLVISPNDDKVAVYEEENENSKVNTYVPINTEVNLIDQLELFSHVEYTDTQTGEIVHGFVKNENLKLKDGSSSTNDVNQQKESDLENQKDPEPTQENSEATENINLTDKGNKKKKDNVVKEEASNESKATSTKSNLNQTTLNGIAIKSPTNVYVAYSTDSEVLKSYNQGSILKFKSFTSDWYQVTVYVNGKPTTGYIRASDVEKFPDSQKDLKGIALKQPTRIYQTPSSNSKVLKSYDQGSVLKYKSFISGWYQATVYVNGKPTTGYIRASDVHKSDTSKAYEGFVLQHNTKVYSKASTNSKVLKSYAKGSYVKYKSFIPNWYQATVYINGKPTIGYFNKNDLIGIDSKNPKSLRAIGIKNIINVYNSTTGNNVIKTYPEGNILKVRTYSKDWYQATVYVNRKAYTGYISVKDLEIISPNQQDKTGYAIGIPTNIYSTTSKKSKVLKNYNYGSKLKFKTFSNDWYEAKVYINGKPFVGYIHADDVSSNSVINKTKYNLTMNQALEMQMKVGPQTDQPYAYVSKSYIDKSGNVTADVLNVRSGPGITYKSIGKLYKDTKVKILKETGSWYTIQYVSNQWVYAHADDVRYYLDPTNFQSDPIQQYQFLDLSKPSGASVQVLNKFLKGKGILDGLGKDFLDASRKNGINDLYLVSHALLETGNGSSVLANGVKHKGVTVYNMFGIGANDGCAIECGAQRAYKEGWTTPSKAVVGGAKFIANQYIKDGRNTLYKMRWNPASMEKHKEASYQYATDIGWASKQIYTMYNLYQEIGSYILYLDIPTYKS